METIEPVWPWFVIWASVATNMILAYSLFKTEKKLRYYSQTADMLKEVAYEHYQNTLQAREEIIQQSSDIIKLDKRLESILTEAKDIRRYSKLLEDVILKNGWELPLG